MVRLRHSSSERPRVRLNPTPLPNPGAPMTTTVAGIRFSDQMGHLLAWAVAHDFRVEKDERGKNAKGVVVYAPDRDHAPISIDERGARFNRAHFENVRRDLIRAGMPPLPTDKELKDAAAVISEIAGSAPKPGVAAQPADAMDPLQAALLAGSPPGSRALRLGPIGLVETRELAALFDDPEKNHDIVGSIAAGLAERVGVGLAESALVGSLMETVVVWANNFNADRLGQITADIESGLKATHRSELKAATDLAEEAEARAVAAERKAERAEARGADTGRQLTEALARATAAETEARQLRDALAPLRAVLGQADR